MERKHQERTSDFYYNRKKWSISLFIILFIQYKWPTAKMVKITQCTSKILELHFLFLFESLSLKNKPHCKIRKNLDIKFDNHQTENVGK